MNELQLAQARVLFKQLGYNAGAWGDDLVRRKCKAVHGIDDNNIHSKNKNPQ